MAAIGLNLVEQFNTRRYPGGASPRAELRQEIVRRWVAKTPPKRIGDVGCNDGLLGELLLHDGHVVCGVDISEPALALARQRGLEVYRCNLESEALPFAAGSFDVITCLETIAHIFDLDHLLDEVWRVLEMGGQFLVTTPNVVSLGRRLNHLLGRAPFLESSLSEPGAAGALRFLTKDSLFGLLTRHRFQPRRFTSDYVNFTASGAFRSRFLSRLFPTWGGSLIVEALKVA